MEPPYSSGISAQAATNLHVESFVGASVARYLPAIAVNAHPDEVAAPLAAAGFDLAQMFYFGESVLRADRRGLGLGHRFFDEREAHARRLGYRHASFCAVERAADDPRRPADYVPLDRFWTKRGFVRRPDIVGTFSWLDVGDEVETEKSMVFWVKDLESGR
jgi:GNAT superfamily N-acetyltransferase